MRFLRFLRAWGEQSLIAADQAVNAIFMPLFTWSIGMSDETLSARCFRAWRDGRVWGRFLLPVIDLLFFWQGPDHCRNAYIKELERRNLPPEYREKP